MNDSKIQVGLKKLPIHLQSSQNRLLIKGGRIVNDDRSFIGDVYIEDGVIKQVGLQLTIPGGVKILDATGKLVIPGGIDVHTHFQMPAYGLTSSDDFYSGTRAAIAGGTTTIIDFVYASKGASLLKMYEQYRELADAKVCCDYGLHVVVPCFNDIIAKEMEVLVKEKGVNSFQLFFAFADRMLDDEEAFNVMKTCKQLGAVALVHAENGKLIELLEEQIYESGIHGPEGHLYSRPEGAEVEAINRVITLADAAGCPLYVSPVMNASVVHAISEARHKGSLVLGEVIAAALGTDGRQYFHRCWRHAAGHVMSPPLRPDSSTALELMRCLGDDKLEVTGSDHCVFKAEQKAVGKDDFRKIPTGINGVEDRMSVVWERGVVPGILDPRKFVAVTSTNAAKIFNLYPRKGRIEVGSDADVVIWDGQSTRTISAATHHQNVDFNVFEGMCCHGIPVTVLSGGRVVVEDGVVHVTQGAGRFISRAPFSPYVYDRLKAFEETRAIKPVFREPYNGPISTLFSTNGTDSQKDLGVGDKTDYLTSIPRTRSPTRAGGRNMQESSFSLSGAQIDDYHQPRPSIRTKQPPGGASTALW